ncbi:MAG: 1-acyl-sn-glycerol-3-phosphate acyltransferase, partial [bacterium]|nr:1-acyl-sn-glycerol-3-phosphate acyltransferase [bacterium]
MLKMKSYIFSVWAWLFGGTAFISWVLVVMVVGLFHTGRFLEWVLNSMCRWMFLVAGIRVVAEGLEHVEKDNQYIIMMNHVNMLDGFVLYRVFPGKARGVEEMGHFKWFFYGTLMRRIGQIPINRSSGRQALEALKEAGRMIRERKGYSIIVLPEGTRTLTGQLGVFKKGGFLLALESGLDILPVVQSGGFEVKRKGHWLVRPGKITLTFHPPIPTKDYTRKTINQLVDRTRACFTPDGDAASGGSPRAKGRLP